jgi:tetratricopeptide (TPR) repeat protein
MYYSVKAKEAIEPVIDLALKSDDKRKLSQMFAIMGAYKYWVEENIPSALKYLEDAFNLSEKQKDVVSHFFACGWLGLALSNNCEFEKGLGYLEKTIDINVAANNLWGISTMKSCASLYYYYFSGNIDPGYQTSNEAIRIAEESGDVFSKAIAYTAHGISCYGKGLFEEAAAFIKNGAGFCERINLLQWNAIAQFNLAEIYYDIGEHQQSEEHYTKAIRLFEKNRSSPSTVGLAKLGLVRNKVLISDSGYNSDLIHRDEYESSYKIHDGWKARYISEILLHMDEKRHLSEAEDWIGKAIKADQNNGMRLNLAKDYAFCSELAKRKGSKLNTKENRTKAIEIFNACGAVGWAERYEREWSGIS